MKTATRHLPGLALTDHTFTLPLDYARPDGEQIEVFAREVVAAGREEAQLPWLVFFQGGPGFASPRPMDKRSNHLYYERYPEDVEHAQAVVSYLSHP